MTATKRPVGWDIRGGGTMMPDRETQNAVRRQNDNPGGHYTDTSLGELIVQSLNHGMYVGTHDNGVDRPSFEGTVLETLALELEALAIAAGRESDNSEAVELFDLQGDPEETRNLAENIDLAEHRRRLETALRQWQEQTADPLLDGIHIARLKWVTKGG